MSKQFIVAVVGKHKIGSWIIPQNVQTVVCHNVASTNKEKISFIITEYRQSTSVPNLMTFIKKNKKKIRKIIFVSILQLGINKNEIYKTLEKLKSYECCFFLEGISTRNLKLKLLKYYINEVFNAKYYSSNKVYFDQNPFLDL